MPNFSSTVAAFDFDHTMTNRDSLLPFLIFIHGRGNTYLKMVPLIPYFLGFLFKIVPRQQMKEKILAHFFQNMALSSLQEKGRQYAVEKLDRIVKPSALERLKWHQQQGHRCVLVSASIDAYLVPWGKRHGFDDVICSQLEVTPDLKVTGKLKGLNCWGPEKTKRLSTVLGQKSYILYAYGDSRGDKELLEMADYPYYRQFG